ncbi:Acyl-coenzyme A thioesterase 13 [Pseudocercospora fuligena]|uniref:Acyl-coenzyme A thioesterase 13 n=1 Tax=Pseudocercospora fuligena TaxID=685502 RepID=A0A8H6RGV6_9PEZI|nr:Acyl-coenzyme A thioesterase 13 [Pseudocercospora fuligena]
MASDTGKTAEHAHIEQIMQSRVLKNGIYKFLLSDVQITSASKGEVVARLLLSENHINSQGGIHGSVSATIVDWIGGMAIASWDFRNGTGVSVDIHVTYQSSAKVGEEIEIEGIAERVGGNLAFTKVGIYKVEDGKRGKIVATGTHTKFVKGTEPKEVEASTS